MDFCSPLCFGKIRRCRWSLGFRDNVGFKKVICHPEQKKQVIIYYYHWLLLYSAVLCVQADSLRSKCMGLWVTGSFSIVHLFKISRYPLPEPCNATHILCMQSNFINTLRTHTKLQFNITRREQTEKRGVKGGGGVKGDNIIAHTGISTCSLSFSSLTALLLAVPPPQQNTWWTLHCCHIGEYISLDLFYSVNLTSSCSLMPWTPQGDGPCENTFRALTLWVTLACHQPHSLPHRWQQQKAWLL